MLPYQDVSRKIEKRRQPFWWTPKQIEAEVTDYHEPWRGLVSSELFEEVNLKKRWQYQKCSKWNYFSIRNTVGIRWSVELVLNDLNLSVKIFLQSAPSMRPCLQPITAAIFMEEFCSDTGHALAQPFRHELLTAEIRVQFRVTSCEILGGQSGTGAGFSSSYFCSPLPVIIPPFLRTHQTVKYCGISLTRLHTIRSSVSKLGTSQHLAGYGVSNLRYLLFITLFQTSCKSWRLVPAVWRVRDVRQYFGFAPLTAVIL